jgi:peptidoglycan/LPS O-acetylase OafA/YrhL
MSYRSYRSYRTYRFGAPSAVHGSLPPRKFTNFEEQTARPTKQCEASFDACALVSNTARRALSPIASTVTTKGRHDRAVAVNTVGGGGLTRNTQHHFSALDGLRGIAALVVLALHALTPFNLDHIVPHAVLAVDFFFLLSGFVIGYAYEHRLLANMSVREFIRVRLIRLYPLILVGTLFGFLVFCLKSVLEHHVAESSLTIVVALACSILMLPTSLIHDQGWESIYPFNPPAWSLFFEILINVVYALLLRKLSSRAFKVILVFSCLVVFVQAYYLNGVAGGEALRTIASGFGRVLFPFFFGVLLFRWQLAHSQFRFSLPVVILSVLLVATLICPSGPFKWIYESAIVVFVFPAIVLLGARTEPTPAFKAACLFLGKLSYPLYILHYPFIRLFSHLARVLAVRSDQIWILVSVEMICAVVFAIIAMKVFDEPVRAWLTMQWRSASPIRSRGLQILDTPPTEPTVKPKLIGD